MKFSLITHSVVLVKCDEPYSDGFAFVLVVAELSRIAAVPLLEHNHCACECKSMCGSR